MSMIFLGLYDNVSNYYPGRMDGFSGGNLEDNKWDHGPICGHLFCWISFAGDFGELINLVFWDFLMISEYKEN